MERLLRARKERKKKKEYSIEIESVDNDPLIGSSRLS
jgi:hypothetical protein